MSITDAEKISKLVKGLSKRIDDLRNDMNHRFGELRNEMNHRFKDTNHRIAIVQWEVRVWFLVLMALITILTFLKPRTTSSNKLLLTARSKNHLLKNKFK